MEEAVLQVPRPLPIKQIDCINIVPIFFNPSMLPACSIMLITLENEQLWIYGDHKCL